MKMIHILLMTTIGLSLFAQDDTKPKSYNLEQFLNASNRELQAHRKQLDELQAQDKLHITPSQAQLFYPDPTAKRKQLEVNLLNYTQREKPMINPRWWGGNVAHSILTPKQMTALNKAITTEERIYRKGGATVYHSTNPRAYGESYIRTKEADLLRELQGMPVAPSKWLMLRDVNPHYSHAVEKKKRKEYITSGTRSNDEVPEESAHLMSCSIGLSSTTVYDSSLYFWLRKESAINRPHTLTFSGQYAPELQTLAHELYDDIDKLDEELGTGVLLQMALRNKLLLNKLMYTSQPYGHKWNYSIGAKKPARLLTTPQELIETIVQEPSEIPMLEPLTFATPPQIGEAQVRVVLTADKMLDPTNPKIRNNIEFHAYADNQQALDEFHTKVDAHFAQAKDRVMQNYQARYRAMTLPQKFWHNVQAKFCQPQSYTERKNTKIREQEALLAQ